MWVGSCDTRLWTRRKLSTSKWLFWCITWILWNEKNQIILCGETKYLPFLPRIFFPRQFSLALNVALIYFFHWYLMLLITIYILFFSYSHFIYSSHVVHVWMFFSVCIIYCCTMKLIIYVYLKLSQPVDRTGFILI